MSQKNESNVRAFNLKYFQEINVNNFNSYTPQSFQNVMGRSSRSVKKVFLEISQNFQEITCARVHFLIKLLASGLQLY